MRRFVYRIAFYLLRCVHGKNIPLYSLHPLPGFLSVGADLVSLAQCLQMKQPLDREVVQLSTDIGK